MIPQDELHVVFGTGPVGLATMHELLVQGKCVRLVNRSGTVVVPEGPDAQPLLRGGLSVPEDGVNP
jgi:hypothetical protein